MKFSIDEYAGHSFDKSTNAKGMLIWHTHSKAEIQHDWF